MTKKHIVSVELDQRKDKKYRNPDILLDYIESRIVDAGQYDILLDDERVMIGTS